MHYVQMNCFLVHWILLYSWKIKNNNNKKMNIKLYHIFIFSKLFTNLFFNAPHHLLYIKSWNDNLNFKLKKEKNGRLHFPNCLLLFSSVVLFRSRVSAQRHKVHKLILLSKRQNCGRAPTPLNRILLHKRGRIYQNLPSFMLNTNSEWFKRPKLIAQKFVGKELYSRNFKINF